MRKLTPMLVAALVAVLPTLAVTAPADAKPARPRAELVAKGVTGTFSAGKVSASASVKNKGSLKAGPSQTAFRLSADGVASSDDPVLGTVDTGKVKPKKSKKVSGVFTVPASVVPGTYRLVACADSGLKVKERKDTNNCKASRDTLTVTVSPGTLVPVSATAGTGGTVAASAITGGTCAASSCTFPGGIGKVTFTPTPNSGYRFGAWTGTTCNGFTTGAGNAITFTNPSTAHACTASFVKQVTISWSVAPAQVVLVGSVAGVATNGACTSDPVTGDGSCLVDAGVGTVTLTATQLVLPFQAWSGTSCVSTSNPLVISAPAADIACTATFGLI